MAQLREFKCIPCSGDEPPLAELEYRQYLGEIPDWEIQKEDGIPRLRRVFKFKNFAQALEFTNRVGELAESDGHHPAILTEWGKVTISWWTHKIKGLHRNDFIMAARTDAAYQG